MTTKRRELRIFLSSTFRDMQAERDYLIKQVFPEIRQACRARQVEFTEVDLRWGVTAEEAEQGRVVRICLEEIDRCRPYFLSFLGERYGWSPGDGDLQQKALLIRDFPVVESSLREGKSVTEMEILHGVLENPAMAEHCFFYFRAPNFTRSLAELSKRRAEFFEDLPGSKAKLEMLKARIRNSSLPLREGYGNLESLGNAVRADLLEALNHSFPAEHVPSPKEIERIAHRAYAEDRSLAYVPDETDLARLDSWLWEPTKSVVNPPLVVWGSSGSGKSSLLAHWISQLQEQSPARFIIEHYAGVTGDATPSSILYRIMAEIRDRLGVPEPLPTTPERILEAFPGWLARVSSDDPLLLLLDGLNQVEGDYCRWLPRYWPANVKLVLSTLPSPQLEVLKHHKWAFYQIAVLDNRRRARVICDYLAVFRKSLSAEQIDRIAGTEQCSNPLFLKLVLLELRIFGSFDKLDRQIGHMLSATGPEALFEIILARMEQDYGRGGVSAVMSAICCARKGLSENELLGFTGLSRLEISNLLIALDYQLARRGGHLCFFHDYLRQAVERRYLATPARRRRMHGRLADYFSAQPIGDRRIEELPWQLERSSRRRALKDCLTSLPMFEGIIAIGRIELLGYWRSIKDNYDPGPCYRRVARRWRQETPADTDRLAGVLNKVGLFLANECASYREAEHFYLLAKRELSQAQAPDQERLADILGNLAVVRRDKGDFSRARRDCERAIRLLEREPGNDSLPLMENLNVLAGLYYAMGEPGRTEAIYRRIIDTCKSRGRSGEPQLALAMNDLAFVLRNRGAYDEAEQLARQGLDIREHLFGANDPVVATSLNNLAELLRIEGQLDEAEKTYMRALQIRSSLFGPHHPTVATLLDNLSLVLKARGQLDEAEALSRQALEIRAEVLGQNHTNFARGLTNLAEILCDKGFFAESLALAREALSIREQQLGLEHPDVATTLAQLGRIYSTKGELAYAAQALTRAAQIRSARLGEAHPLLAESLFDLSQVTSSMGNREEATSQIKGALRIAESVFGAQDSWTQKIRTAYTELIG